VGLIYTKGRGFTSHDVMDVLKEAKEHLAKEKKPVSPLIKHWMSNPQLVHVFNTPKYDDE
jgi:hypothetical protein